jgi:XTP/dITP diphosphohydrolase/tetrapyrrole methylase family protein/MazG family protein
MSDKIYDAEYTEPDDGRDAYADFIAIVRQLRRDCPWDREQTHESVCHLLIEETYEAIEAIDEGDMEALKEELGDLLLHVAFHSVIAEQAGRFTMREVVEAQAAKLVRRHPHVFGEAEAEDAGEVLESWEQIKMDEGEKESALEGVPAHLPALLRALRIQEKAAGVGFDFPDRDGAWAKVEEEIREFRTAVESETADDDEKEREFGDVLFALVNYARQADLNPTDALRRANGAFERRFRHVENRLAEENRAPDEASLSEMDALWEEAKKDGSY